MKKRPLRRVLLPAPDAGAIHAASRRADGTIRLEHKGGGMVASFQAPARIVCILCKRSRDGSAEGMLDAIHRAQFYWAQRGIALRRYEAVDENNLRGAGLGFIVEGEREAIEYFSLHEKDLVRIWEDVTQLESSWVAGHAKAFHSPRKPRPGKAKPGKRGGALHTITFDKMRKDNGETVGPY